MIIIGAGMAGLLAANMLRRFSPKVIEAKPSLPHNHTAVLRFRTPAVSNALGIPFERVVVNKGIWDGEKIHTNCNIRLANIYSKRVSGGLSDRSIWSMEREERWVAPEDFVERIAEGVNIEFGKKFDPAPFDSEPVVSTMPMPRMIELVGSEHEPNFSSRSILTYQLTLPFQSEVHQTIYNCSPFCSKWYRATLQGNLLIVETTSDQPCDKIPGSVFAAFGLGVEFDRPKKNPIPYGKILSINESIRRDIIYKMTSEHNIYSLGRFATWRPKLLMDDLVGDIEMIERMIVEDSKYFRKISNLKKS